MKAKTETQEEGEGGSHEDTKQNDDPVLYVFKVQSKHIELKLLTEPLVYVASADFSLIVVSKCDMIKMSYLLDTCVLFPLQIFGY